MATNSVNRMTLNAVMERGEMADDASAPVKRSNGELQGVQCSTVVTDAASALEQAKVAWKSSHTKLWEKQQTILQVPRQERPRLQQEADELQAECDRLKKAYADAKASLPNGSTQPGASTSEGASYAMMNLRRMATGILKGETAARVECWRQHAKMSYYAATIGQRVQELEGVAQKLKRAEIRLQFESSRKEAAVQKCVELEGELQRGRAEALSAYQLVCDRADASEARAAALEDQVAVLEEEVKQEAFKGSWGIGMRMLRNAMATQLRGEIYQLVLTWKDAAKAAGVKKRFFIPEVVYSLPLFPS